MIMGGTIAPAASCTERVYVPEVKLLKTPEEFEMVKVVVANEKV
jgi:hypothetical protein